MPTGYSKAERRGSLLVVTLTRPAALNSLNAPACFELDAIWTDFENDPELKVAILTGEGRAFSAGHDLKDDTTQAMPPSGFGGLAIRPGRTKPIIAAINGLAFGGGVEMALACDILIADERATFSMPEPRYGGAALSGGVQRLVKRMPPAVAMGLLLTGRIFDAPEAYRWGMLTEIAPGGSALQMAERLADQILEFAPLAIQYTLRGALEVIEGAEVMADIIRRHMTTYVPFLNQTQDMAEGLAAFAAKRRPAWKGR
jgi:enoyl-CoA hydratase/carnithine racemase